MTNFDVETNTLYENLAPALFADVAATSGFGPPSFNQLAFGIVAADFDRDGRLDFYVGNGHIFERPKRDNTSYRQRDQLLMGVGGGRFRELRCDVLEASPDVSRGVAAADYDNDGDPDIHLSNWGPNRLYRNNGDGTFDEVGAATKVNDPNGATLGVMFTDFDGDHDLDIYVANDFGYFFAPNTILRNEHPLDVFTDVGEPAGVDTAINGMGIAVGDYDEDGDLDYYVTNIKGNSLFENLGDSAGFAEVATFKAVNVHFSTSWGTAFLDYDNDTHLDLVVANGRVMPSYNLADPDHVQRLIQPHANKLFRNDGRGSFVDVSELEGVADTSRCRGLAYADYDKDGDLDFAVAALTHVKRTKAHALLYQNLKGGAQNWLEVSLQGTASNRDGFGSRVRVVAGKRSWIREIDGGTSYLSQHSSIAHFGLADLPTVDSLIVTWPGGNREAFTDIKANQTLHVVENTSISYASRGKR